MKTRTPTSEDVSTLLQAWSGGDHKALDRLTPIVYHELHSWGQHSMILTRIRHLEQKVESGSGVTPQDSHISCSLEPDAAGSLFKLLRVMGKNFKGGEEVRLKITSTKDGENPFTQTHQTTATPDGTIDFRYGSGFCGSQHMTFQVQGTGLTSNKVSEVATAGC